MTRPHFAGKLFVFSSLGLLFSCTSFPTIYPPLKSEDFSQEISRVEFIAKASPDIATQANALLKLAVLYSHHMNPNPNYPMALKELETYVSLNPEGGNADEVQNWLAVLRRLKKEIDANKEIKAKMGQFIKENQEIKVKIEQLIRENEEKKKTIEQLKSLDIQIEEKRKQVK